MPNNTAYRTIAPAPVKEISTVLDFSQILDKYGLAWRTVDFHYLVGEILQEQGWILHISIVRWQIAAALDRLIPLLVEYKAAFKVVKDMDAAKNLLDGELGNAYIGKVLTAYAASIDDYTSLAKKLIEVVQHYRGPAVLTDIHLGGNVYTRYGGFKPVILPDNHGKDSKWIYNTRGDLVPDVPYIPFRMPEGQAWPFGEIAKPEVPKRNSILNGIYKPLFPLKFDAKGNVIKALYVRNVIFVNKCVIKEGKKDMWSDEAGRDMRDRLAWQKKVHEQLAGVVPIPKILDLFYEQEDAYLAMEFVKGPSLYDFQFRLNRQCAAWHTWPVEWQLQIVDFLLQIIQILGKMHAQGFVHRDLTPVNFLVGKGNQLILIDIELAYSMKTQTPRPPFEFGTHGFMSPEQTEVRMPRKEEDIYALGATMITMLAGLPPIVFDAQEKDIICRHLNFFIRNDEMSTLISRCLDHTPEKRPSLPEILSKVSQYRECLKTGTGVQTSVIPTQVDLEQLKAVINGAIRGLVSEPTLIDKHLWFSKAQDSGGGTQKKGYSKSGGFYEGITGVLYFLAKTSLAGFDIQACQKAYETGWRYITKNHLDKMESLSPGLYGGSAGVAMGLAAGMRAGLLADDPENRQMLYSCLNIPTSCPDIASGTAGQGVAILHSLDYINGHIGKELLDSVVDRILSSQDKKGVWVMYKDGKGKHAVAANFSYGNTGITWFLQQYYQYHPDERVRVAILLSLKTLNKLVPELERSLRKKGFRNTISDFQTRNGISGVILNFINAYEQWGDSHYRKVAERLLQQFPANIVHENFSLDVGLARMGELYLEAFRVIKNDEWLARAAWIAQFFTHTRKSGPTNEYYWLTNNTQLPTADLMTGNCGIIHFLIRYNNKENTHYRFTP